MISAILGTSAVPLCDPGYDRIVELQTGVRAVAIRNVPGTLPFFSTHFPRQPILPGVLLLESMAALAATTAGAGIWRLRNVRGLRFRHFVLPGDQVTISVDLRGHTGHSTEWRAEASVEGRVVSTARTLTLARTHEGDETAAVSQGDARRVTA